jgi:hypothetical protein
MTEGNRTRTMLVAAVVSAGLLAPAGASAHGRRGGGHGGGVVVVGGGGFYSPWWGLGAGYYGYWGPWGWGGLYPPAYYGPEGGVPMSVALMSGFGGVDLDVKPNRADVWVDGKYVGEARDFDGYPSYLWLKEGVHRLQIQKGGYKVFDEEIEMQPGLKKNLKVRLEPGESEPPAAKGDAKAMKDAPKDAAKDESKAREKKF